MLDQSQPIAPEEALKHITAMLAEMRRTHKMITEAQSPYLNTKQVMEFLQVKSYEKFNAILTENNILPSFRGGEGNMYHRDQLLNILPKSTNDLQPKGFYKF